MGKRYGPIPRSFPGLIRAVRDVLVRFARWQTPLSFVSAMISLILALIFLADLVIGHPHLQRGTVLPWLVLFLAGALVPLVLGKRYTLGLGVLMAVGIELWSSYFLLFSDHPHAEINALLALPFSALYAGWFFPTSIAMTFMVLSMLRVCATLVLNPHLGEGIGSPLTLLSYAVLISLFTFGGARAVRRQVRVQAARDPLTGVLNRRGLFGGARRLRERAARRDLPVAIAIIDFDDFKLVNEAGGHAAGDAALIESASEWRRLVEMRGNWEPSKGIVARLGGDEFVLVMMGGVDELEARIARCRRDASYAWSWGVSEVRAGERLEAAIARADTAMFDSKQSGG
ncbi:MAG: GGDEF domain-containing protein [Leucobacter sp.]